MWEDPIVAEVRRVREQLSSRFGYDVKAIFDDIRKAQAALGVRLVRQKRRAEPAEQASPTDSSLKTDSRDMGPGD